MSLIITEHYLKEYSNINKNVDMSILTPAIYDAQSLRILPLLGTRLYNECISQIATSTISALNQTLLDLIAPCLIHYAKMESLPDIKYRVMNKGIQVLNSQNSESADLQEIQFLMDRERNKAEEYAERITRYLVQNSTDYPLYYQNGNYDEIQPNKTNVTGGIYVGQDEKTGRHSDNPYYYR